MRCRNFVKSSLLKFRVEEPVSLFSITYSYLIELKEQAVFTFFGKSDDVCCYSLFEGIERAYYSNISEIVFVKIDNYANNSCKVWRQFR